MKERDVFELVETLYQFVNIKVALDLCLTLVEHVHQLITFSPAAPLFTAAKLDMDEEQYFIKATHPHNLPFLDILGKLCVLKQFRHLIVLHVLCDPFLGLITKSACKLVP